MLSSFLAFFKLARVPSPPTSVGDDGITSYKGLSTSFVSAHYLIRVRAIARVQDIPGKSVREHTILGTAFVAEPRSSARISEAPSEAFNDPADELLYPTIVTNMHDPARAYLSYNSILVKSISARLWHG